MAERVTTGNLLKRIFKTKSLSTYLKENEEHLHPEDFCTCLKELCRKKNLIAERVIEKGEIERTYGHQLFNGTRRPSRDKVLQLAFGLEATVEETQKMLRAAGKSALYPRLKRDAVILYCLKNRIPFLETQDILESYGLTIIGGTGDEKQ